MPDRPDHFRAEGAIVKTVPEQRLVFGWASIVEKNGSEVVDHHGDIIAPAELESAAYDFVLSARVAGEMHERVGVGEMVESVVFTPEKVEAIRASLCAQGVENVELSLGVVGWWVGFRLDEDTFAKVKDGTFPMFSIHGVGVRTPADD